MQREKLNILTMKSKKFILTALAAVTLSAGANAQSDSTQVSGDNAKGPYITNSTGSNWFIGAGAGISTSFSKKIGMFSEFSLKNNFDAEVFVGKWFTPNVGTRVGYKGGTNNFGYDDKEYLSQRFNSGQQIRFGYFHGDLLWNLSNFIGGYKEDRFWDFIPYLGGGIFGINDGKTDVKAAVSAGIYNEIRINRVVNLYLDFSLLAFENPTGLKYAENRKPVVDKKTSFVARPMYMPTINVGVTFNLSKKKNFDRASGVANHEEDAPDDLSGSNNPQDRANELEKDNNDLKDLNEKLKKENEQLRDSLAKAQKAAEDAANNNPNDNQNANNDVNPNDNNKSARIMPLVIYFPRGSAVINDTEMAHFEQWLSLHSEAAREMPVTITGSADSHTGTAAFNQMLAQERANVLKRLLAANGFKNVTTKTIINDSLGSTNARNRAAKLE